jgi:hypothetical protein
MVPVPLPGPGIRQLVRAAAINAVSSGSLNT